LFASSHALLAGKQTDRQTEEVVVKIDRKTRDRERDQPENRKKKKKKWLGLGKIGSLVSSLVPIEKEGMSKMLPSGKEAHSRRFS